MRDWWISSQKLHRRLLSHHFELLLSSFILRKWTSCTKSLGRTLSCNPACVSVLIPSTPSDSNGTQTSTQTSSPSITPRTLPAETQARNSDPASPPHLLAARKESALPEAYPLSWALHSTLSVLL